VRAGMRFDHASSISPTMIALKTMNETLGIDLTKQFPPIYH